MLDTHAVARSLTAADFTPAQADAVTDALRLVAEQGDHVTSDQFKAGLAEIRGCRPAFPSGATASVAAAAPRPSVGGGEGVPHDGPANRPSLGP